MIYRLVQLIYDCVDEIAVASNCDVSREKIFLDRFFEVLESRSILYTDSESDVRMRILHREVGFFNLFLEGLN